MASQSKLVDFFISLQDAEALKRFHADPEAAMAAAGLSDAEKDAVRRQDQQEIRSLLGVDNQGLRLVFVPS